MNVEDPQGCWIMVQAFEAMANKLVDIKDNQENCQHTNKP